MSSKVELNPLTWAGDIRSEESLIGLISRRAGEHFLGRTTVILQSCAIKIKFPGQVANSVDDEQLAELARIMRVDEAKLRSLAWKKVGEDRTGELISWGSRSMRLRDLETRLRWISPTTLKRQTHHRSSWMNRLLPYCPDSFEELIASCPSCKRNLCWTTARGLARCEDRIGCEHGAKDIDPTERYLPKWLRARYKLFASLISSDDTTQQNVRANGLAPDIAALTNPALIDLTFALGRVERPANETMSAYFYLSEGNLKAAEYIATGMKFLEHWPKSIEALADEALSERLSNRYKLDRLKRLPAELNNSEITKLLLKTIPAVYLRRQTALASDEAPVMLGDELKTLSGLQANDIHKIVEAEILGIKFLNRGKRNQVQFDRALCNEFIRARRGSVMIEKIVEALNLPYYAILQIMGRKRLSKVENDAVALVHPEGRVWQASLDDLCNDLKEVAGEPPTNEPLISLSAASRIFGGDLKPWAGIIETLLLKEVACYLKRDAERATSRSLLIAKRDLSGLKRAAVVRPSLVKLPSQISKRDLLDVLNLGANNLRDLENHHLVTFQKRGSQLATDFAAALALAAERIFRAEASLISDAPHIVIDDIANENGIAEMPGGGWPRSTLEAVLRARSKKRRT